MSYRYGFKTEANALVSEVRNELGLSPYMPLNPQTLADSLGIPVIRLSVLAQDRLGVRYFLATEPDAFSAVTVFSGTRRTIVHNDAHARSRQHSNVTHELAHGLLLHPPTPALDNKGCRYWDQAIEDEATWLAGALLVPEAAALSIAQGRWTVMGAADHFGVSVQMIRFRLNTTGAMKRTRNGQRIPSSR